jgi:hypothetical protein
MRAIIILGAALFAVALIAGCSTQVAPKDAVTDAPFVEAYLEYVGPPEKWAGPGTLMVHLTAKDLNSAEVALSPDLIEQIIKRHQTSKVPPLTPVTATTRPTGELAREKFAYLAEAISTDKSKFFGCLYPLRARLIRSNGAVVEKQGCRSFQGWPSIASRTVSQMLAMIHIDNVNQSVRTETNTAHGKK